MLLSKTFEHEKEKGAWVPSRDDEPSERDGDESSDLDTSVPPIALIEENKFNEVQRALIHSEDLLPGIAFGVRTGFLIAHQRAPQEMTRFADDIGKIELDTSRDHLWVVAVSADAVEKHRSHKY